MRPRISRHIRLISGPAQLRTRLRTLIRQPIFWFVTVWGHAVILFGTLTNYYFEAGHNPRIESLFDSLYWAVATVALVGDGSRPVTTGGKFVAMAVMILGSLFLWSYMAMFVGWLITPEIRVVEDELRSLETVLKEKGEI